MYPVLCPNKWQGGCWDWGWREGTFLTLYSWLLYSTPLTLVTWDESDKLACCWDIEQPTNGICFANGRGSGLNSNFGSLY